MLFCALPPAGVWVNGSSKLVYPIPIEPNARIESLHEYFVNLLGLQASAVDLTQCQRAWLFIKAEKPTNAFFGRCSPGGPQQSFDRSDYEAGDRCHTRELVAQRRVQSSGQHTSQSCNNPVQGDREALRRDSRPRSGGARPPTQKALVVVSSSYVGSADPTMTRE